MATVIFKPTEACNARCAYCDVVHKASYSTKQMSYEVLELVFRRIDEYLASRPEERIHLIWHGGEPLLLGPEYFRRALQFQQKHCAATADRIEHSIQTNLTLMTRELARALKDLGMGGVGTSYDPIDGVRGLGSKRDSAAYNKRFLDGISLLEEEGLGWGFIYVVTKLSLNDPLKLFRTLLNLSPKGAFMFNPVLLYGNEQEHLRISPEEYCDFLGAIFPAWWQRRQELMNVEPFASLARNLLENSRSLGCGDSGNCAYSHLNVQPDGSLSQCGRSADWGLLNYGSLLDKSFAEAFADPQREQLVKRNAILADGECKNCRFWEICHGGCPLDGWASKGSFFHKSDWCAFKRGFIVKYFEPMANPNGARVAPASVADEAPSSEPASSRPLPILAPIRLHGAINALKWINPVGGLGDTLMLAGVLKHVVDRDPSQKFNLVERTKYWPILEGHPAIAAVGSPPPGAEFISTAYWDHPDYAAGKRAYQVLATMFGLEPPVEERLYVAWKFEAPPFLDRALRSGQRHVLICPTSDSPRKQMSIARWEALVAMLREQGMGVVQVGRALDCYIRGAYSLLGLTTPRQLISTIRHFDAVITSDSFVMHAAHLCAVPAVVLWGPTDHRVYGYAGQVHFQGVITCEYSAGCIGPGRGALYSQPCPHGSEHCVDTVPLDAIRAAVVTVLQSKQTIQSQDWEQSSEGWESGSAAKWSGLSV